MLGKFIWKTFTAWKEGSVAQIPRNEKCEIKHEGGRQGKTNKNDANANNMFCIKMKLS